MKVARLVSCLIVAWGLLLTSSGSRVNAVEIARFNFDNPANRLENLAAGPDGELLGGVVINEAAGLLEADTDPDPDLDQGFSIPLGALNPFGGDSDWRVQFDFASSATSGLLFSSDGSAAEEPFPDGQEGSLNIFLNGGAVGLDFWYIGAIATEDTYNDDAFHTVEASYVAETGLVTLIVDGLEEIDNGEGWIYSRDATMDRTRFGDDTNADAGVDWNPEGFIGSFDNILIEAPSPPPVLVTIDRDTGGMSLESISGEDFSINSLSFSSPSGSLNRDNWKSIAGNYDVAGDGSVDPNGNWTITAETATELSESTEGDGATIMPGQPVDLGTQDVWLRSPFQDVRVALFETSLGETVSGAVAYIGTEILFGDLNLDGDLSGLDWDLFVSGYGQELTDLTQRDAYFLADLNGDFEHSAEDFVAFIEAFDAANGEGAFAATIGVPEPTSLMMLGFGGLGLLALGRRRKTALRQIRPMALVLTLIGGLLVTSDAVQADLLAEYLFENGTDDTSGNGRTGVLDAGIGGDPAVIGGVLALTGRPFESMEIPLGDANPFDGSQDFTIELTFNAALNEDETGYVLFSSADNDDPTEPDNHSMAIFLDGDGSIVYDNFFVNEVRLEGFDYRDAQDHQLTVTFAAPEVLGDPADPNPGSLFMRVDGDWLISGEIAPNVPNIANHSVRVGSSLNEDFPFECEEGCAVLELAGTVDSVRVFDNATAPTMLRAEVDRSTGAITLLGGEFVQDIQFYEIRSEGGSLNAAAWQQNNLDAQNIDSVSDETGQSWDTLAGDANRLAEAFLLGSSIFDDSRSISLGAAYAGGDEDLEITAVTAGREIIAVAVGYIGDAGLDGDFNRDGVVDVADMDLLGTAIAAGANNGVFDLNSDSLVDRTDRDLFLSGGLITSGNKLLGDADFSGDVAFADFAALADAFDQPGLWSMGDFDTDGGIAFSDFVILADNFGRSAVVAAVPEPATGLLLAAGWLSWAILRRHLAQTIR